MSAFTRWCAEGSDRTYDEFRQAEWDRRRELRTARAGLHPFLSPGAALNFQAQLGQYRPRVTDADMLRLRQLTAVSFPAALVGGRARLGIAGLGNVLGAIGGMLRTKPWRNGQ